MATKRKTPKKATAKRKSVKNLSQTHGKEEKFEPTTLDQIWEMMVPVLTVPLTKGSMKTHWMT